jgi:hypothetical protein
MEELKTESDSVRDELMQIVADAVMDWRLKHLTPNEHAVEVLFRVAAMVAEIGNVPAERVETIFRYQFGTERRN